MSEAKDICSLFTIIPKHFLTLEEKIISVMIESVRSLPKEALKATRK